MVLGVLANPRVAVVDVGLVDVLIDNLGHHHEPLRQKVRLFQTTSHTHTHTHAGTRSSNPPPFHGHRHLGRVTSGFPRKKNSELLRGIFYDPDVVTTGFLCHKS